MILSLTHNHTSMHYLSKALAKHEKKIEDKEMESRLRAMETIFGQEFPELRKELDILKKTPACE